MDLPTAFERARASTFMMGVAIDNVAAFAVTYASEGAAWTGKTYIAVLLGLWGVQIALAFKRRVARLIVWHIEARENFSRAMKGWFDAVEADRFNWARPQHALMESAIRSNDTAFKVEAASHAGQLELLDDVWDGLAIDVYKLATDSLAVAKRQKSADVVGNVGASHIT